MVLGSNDNDAVAGVPCCGESLGEFDPAVALYGGADPLWRWLGESARTVWSLVGLGRMASRQGAYERAEALFEEALALARAIGFEEGVALALRALAEVALTRDDHRRAEARYAESHDLSLREPRVPCLVALGSIGASPRP